MYELRVVAQHVRTQRVRWFTTPNNFVVLAIMFRIHLWVVVVALVAVSVAGGGAEDIDAIFPPRLAAVLKKVADAKSIPYGAMISGMLALICAFSPAASWVSSIGGHFEPLIMNFKNVGNSGINKTGATRYFDFVFKTVRGALVSLSLDPLSVWLVAFR